jgi:hypothetical protein
VTRSASVHCGSNVRVFTVRAELTFKADVVMWEWCRVTSEAAIDTRTTPVTAVSKGDNHNYGIRQVSQVSHSFQQTQFV